jgi:hypothetical protein
MRQARQIQGGNMRRILHWGSILLIVLWFVASVAFAQSFGPHTPCGVERWDVKTLNDPNGTDLFKAEAKNTTVDALRNLSAPPGVEVKRAEATRFPAELSFGKVRVPAVILGFKQERGSKKKPGDFDFHIVIAKPENQKLTMIAEIPMGSCVTAPAYREYFTQLQARFVKEFGQPTSTYKKLKTPVHIHATGLAFFDVPHPTPQTGVAPNDIELHPLLDWTVDQ